MVECVYIKCADIKKEEVDGRDEQKVEKLWKEDNEIIFSSIKISVKFCCWKAADDADETIAIKKEKKNESNQWKDKNPVGWNERTHLKRKLSNAKDNES